jgi:hypothetical protein
VLNTVKSSKQFKPSLPSQTSRVTKVVKGSQLFSSNKK